ncbi:MAG: aminopeptidase N [Lautropia sp.]
MTTSATDPSPATDHEPRTRTVKRGDYRAPDYLVPEIHLRFELDPARTLVTARSRVERAPHAAADAALTLDGEDLDLLSIRIDGVEPAPGSWRIEHGRLVIEPARARFELEIVTAISPRDNRQLSGLYASGTMMLTQCEAQGFRRITWAQDRPDVMSRYTVELVAERDAWPILLANGNLVATADLGSRHSATWVDPFAKPSYLFALVAGRLEVRETRLRTASGREVLLQIWVEPGNLDKTEHAMQSLVRAIRWDESRYGLELDLDRFMIVAVSDFNMGAMENKGLNIFNAKYLFANPRIATDADFERIESIVGHEYFHNWTGNRVTCRDWFQLTLKEGLTVFRDQEFSADMLAAGVASTLAPGPDAERAAASARAVHRIESVRVLRAMQFAEDAGPMSHPIRPDAYQAIDNFYTATVYEKGAEVIRMLQTLVGREGFRSGIDLYFERHDGQAVTCDDFVAAIADANARDFSQFMRWYSTRGTPLVQVDATFDAASGRYSLRMRQANGDDAPPLTIPIAIGLLDADGTERLATTLELTREQQSFEFDGFARAPTPSLLRGFSAPVHLRFAYPPDALAFLLANDTDAFNRWEAGQQLMLQAVQTALGAAHVSATAAQPFDTLAGTLVDALERALADPALDDGLKNQLLILPSEGAISDSLDVVDAQALREARQRLLSLIGRRLGAPLLAIVRRGHWRTPYRRDVAAMGPRALANTALMLLCASGAAPDEAPALAQAQFDGADNMTDRQAALMALMSVDLARREAALAAFERLYADEPTVIDKWFTLQATMHALPGSAPVLERVVALESHPAWSATNPNKVRALVHAFCAGNLAEFHRADGLGYAFWQRHVLALDAANPQLASRLARSLERVARFAEPQRSLMTSALDAARASASSPDVVEVLDHARRSIDG